MQFGHMSFAAIKRLLAGAFVVAALALVVLNRADVQAGGKKSDAEVKVTASAAKPDPTGKQVVTVTLAINKGWHVYANPVGNADLASSQTVVKLAAKGKLDDVKITYPPGKSIEDKLVGNYRVYEDKVSILATVKRAPGDTSPLEVSVRISACNDKGCLLPATVKLTTK